MDQRAHRQPGPGRSDPESHLRMLSRAQLVPTGVDQVSEALDSLLKRCCVSSLPGHQGALPESTELLAGI